MNNQNEVNLSELHKEIKDLLNKHPEWEELSKTFNEIELPQNLNLKDLIQSSEQLAVFLNDLVNRNKELNITGKNNSNPYDILASKVGRYAEGFFEKIYQKDQEDGKLFEAGRSFDENGNLIEE
jgi:hypothetical protein